MTIAVDISILLNILGFGQGIFLFFLLLKTRKERPENIYLMMFILSISLIILNSVFRLSYYIDALGGYEEFSNSFLLVIAPSIFLFVKMKYDSSMVRMALLHYIPFLLYFSFILLSFVAFDVSSSLADLIGNLSFLTFNIQFIIYIGLSLYTMALNKPLSKPLKWIKVAIWMITIPWVLRIGFLVIEQVYLVLIPDFLSLNLALLIGICAFFLSYVHSSDHGGFSKKEKYEKSKLSSSELVKNLKLIKTAMEGEQLYLDRKVSLSTVASRINLSARDISLTINQGLHQSFVDFVNGYRIESFKERIRMESSKHYTLSAIAEQCGFQSNSAFYAAFKRHTGITPKQFKDRMDKRR